MSTKEKLLQPVEYSRNSWSYRRWVKYHEGQVVDPTNSCEYRSVVYLRMTMRQVTAPVRKIVAVFRSRSKSTVPPTAPKPRPKVSITVTEKKSPLALRFLWTVLWPIRKFVRFVFVGCYKTCVAAGNFNARHNGRPVNIFGIGLLVAYVGFFLTVLVIFVVTSTIKFLIVCGITFAVIATILLVVLGTIKFLNSDFAAALGDFFVSSYYRVCRKVEFKD